MGWDYFDVAALVRRDLDWVNRVLLDQVEWVSRTIRKASQTLSRLAVSAMATENTPPSIRCTYCKRIAAMNRVS